MHENILVWLILWLLNVLSFQHIEYFMNYTLGSILITVELTFWRRNYFLNFCTPCIYNVNNTGTKYVRFMKQTAFGRGKNGEYIPCLKYSVPVFVE